MHELNAGKQQMSPSEKKYLFDNTGLPSVYQLVRMNIQFQCVTFIYTSCDIIKPGARSHKPAKLWFLELDTPTHNKETTALHTPNCADKHFLSVNIFSICMLWAKASHPAQHFPQFPEPSLQQSHPLTRGPLCRQRW